MGENDPNGSSVVNIIESVVEEFCNDYCKYPGFTEQGELDEHCEACPFNKLM